MKGEAAAHKGGKKNRKHGRKRKKPAQMRYTTSRRWITNKAKRVVKSVRSGHKMPPNLKLEVKQTVKVALGYN